MTFLEENAIHYLISFFIGVILLYINSRIKKKGELDEINDNFKTIITQQEDLTAATESIKSELSKKSIEYQIKLKSFNEKKINAIDIVYKKLINLKQAAKKVSFNHEKVNRKTYLDCVDEFRFEHEINNLWIPKETSEIFEDVAIEIDQKTSPFVLIKDAEDLVKGNEAAYWLSMSDDKFKSIV